MRAALSRAVPLVAVLAAAAPVAQARAAELGERTLERGDLVCFPPGPSGAHRIMNRSDSPARTLLFSSARVPAVSVYPDSDKIGIWAGNEADDLIFRRDTAVAWSDGEEGWDTAS